VFNIVVSAAVCGDRLFILTEEVFAKFLDALKQAASA
jgi:hypothetical protein